MIPAREWPEYSAVRGAEAIWDFYLEVMAAWETEGLDLAEVIDAPPDRVLAHLSQEARGKTSGAGVRFSYWAVTTFRGGNAVRVEWFATRDEAFEAAGLSA
jgi:ketosteroid isomerase-like protein